MTWLFSWLRAVLVLIYLVRDIDFDALVITETWLTSKDSDQKTINDVTPEGYTFHHAPRTPRKGGGVGIFLCDSLKFKQHPCFQSSSFENYQLTFPSGRGVNCPFSFCVLFIFDEEKWPEIL